jgi:hypothetical protein
MALPDVITLAISAPAKAMSGMSANITSASFHPATIAMMMEQMKVPAHASALLASEISCALLGFDSSPLYKRRM